jgi:hypothetical protein
VATKSLTWYQNRIVSQVSFISAIVGVLTAIMAILWNIRVTNEMSKKMERIEQNQERIEQNQIQQLIVNEKLLTIIDLSKR